MAKNTVTLKILGDASSLDKTLDGVEKTLGGFGGKVGGSLGKLGAAIGGAFAVDKIGSFVSDGIGLASDLGEAMSKNSVVFGKFSDDITKAADNAARSAGLSKVQYQDLAGTVGVLGKSAGLAGGDLSSFGTELIARAADVGSFNNATTPEVVEAWGAALRGEAEPMRKFGVLLDENTIKQKAVTLGLIKSVKDGLTPQQKALATNAVIMDQTSLSAGDFARTSDGLANKSRIQAAEFENLKTTLGEKLLPVQLAVTSFITDKLIPALSNIGSTLQAVGAFVVQNKEYFIALGAGIVIALVPAFIAWAVSAGTAAAATIAAAAPVIAIGVAIAALAAGVIYAYEHFDIFRSFVDALADGFTAAFGIIKSVVLTVIDFVVGYFQTWWKVVSNIVGAIVDIFHGDFSGALEHVKTAVAAVKDFVIDKFQGVWDFISGLPGKLLELAPKVLDAALGIGKSIIDGIGKGLSGVAGFVGDLGSSVVSAFKDAANWVIDKLNSAIPDSFGWGPLSIDVPDNPIPHLAMGSSGIANSGWFDVGERGRERVFLPRGASVDPNPGNGGGVAVYVQTNADPFAIAREVAWLHKNSGR